MGNSNLNTFKKVEIDGKEYLLKFDYNAACDLEDVFGKGVAAILNEEQIGFRLVRAFYWAGLKWKEKGITMDRVGKMLGADIQDNGKSLMELMEPVMDALKKSKLLANNEAKNDKYAEDEEETEAGDNEDENPND